MNEEFKIKRGSIEIERVDQQLIACVLSRTQEQKCDYFLIEERKKMKKWMNRNQLKLMTFES